MNRLDKLEKEMKLSDLDWANAHGRCPYCGSKVNSSYGNLFECQNPKCGAHNIPRNILTWSIEME